MKVLRSTSLFTNGILIAGLLTACHQEKEMTPAPESAIAATNHNAKTIAAPLIVKNGTDLIEYAYDGLGRPNLKKVTLTSKGKYITYSYGAQQINATEYHSATKTPLAQYIYKLDGTGKCVEASIGSASYAYEYNADGQLTKMFNKSHVNERTEFEYLPDAPGSNVKSLATMKIYNQYGDLQKKVEFDYDVPNKLIWADLNPLNPEYMTTTTRYLKVFGKFATNLPRIISEDSDVDVTYQLDYLMNANSLPEKVYRSNLNGTNASTTERKYLAPLAQ